MASMRDVECSATLSQTPSQKSFFSLPGELRNRIYGMTFSDCKQNVLMRHPSCSPLENNSNKSRAIWNRLLNPYRGLTQACHLLRTEYVPLYDKRRSISLYYNHVPLYVETFILRGRRHAASLDIFMETYESLADPEPFRPSVDFKQLVDLCLDSRFNLDVYFVLEEAGPAFNQLTNRSNSVWRKYCGYAIAAILVQSHLSYVDIVFKVKKESAKHWMRPGYQGPKKVKAKKSWAKRLGLKFGRLSYNVITDS